MNKTEELKKMIAEMKEVLEKKDKESAEYKEKLEVLSKEFQQKIEEVRKEMEEVLAARKTPVVSGVQYKDIKSLVSMPAYNEDIKRVHRVVDELQLAYDLLGTSGVKSVMSVYEKKFPAEIEVIKAGMGAGAPGAGAEWVPTGYSATLFEELVLALQVAGLHDKIDMPQNPYKHPIAYQDMQAYLVAENTDDTSVTPVVPGTKTSTGGFILNAKRLAARVRFDDELNEDSIVPVLPTLRKNLIKAIAKAIENAIINGGFTDDYDLTARTNDPRNAFDGYRKLAVAQAKVDAGGTLGVDSLLAVRAAMGKYGVDPNDLAWVVSPTVYLKDLLNLKDGNTNVVLTVDKYGPNATILAGELGKCYGIPIIVSEFVREDLNSSGVADNSTAATLSEIILVHRPSFVVGYRRKLNVEIARKVELFQNVIVASVRVAFGTPWADRPVVGILYDVAY